MLYMVVTLDVSKLSGWMNAAAYCRVERRAYDAGLDAGWEAGGRGVAMAQAACMGWALLKAEAQGTRGANVEHAVHVRDAGRVKAQRLVERRRVLPSRKEGLRCGARCGLGGGRAWGGDGASGMHGVGPT